MKGRELRAFLVERDGPRCHWCRVLTRDPVEVGELADCAATVDHLDTSRIRRRVQPDRAVLSCRRCNRDRGCLPVDEWRAVLRYRRSLPLAKLVRLAVALVWWLPSILLALAAIVGDRIRFKAVLAWARLLLLFGRQDAARRVYDAALRRTMRRWQKLAERDAR